MLLATACSSSSAQDLPAKIPSYAIKQDQSTSLGAALAPMVKAHPKMSGFRILTTGSESFSYRLALIQAAEKTLDLQYYIIHDDTTSNLLLKAVDDAARRGVRVRFLIDNMSIGEVANTFSALDNAHNIEIRVFNPLTTRKQSYFEQLVTSVTEIGDLNNRMHNKALIADNQMAISGGRNLGDEYFEENTDVTFKDLDILAAGPITDAISRSFDRYWNSGESVPIGQLYTPKEDPEHAREIRDELKNYWNKVRSTDKGKKLLSSNLAKRLKNNEAPMIWARAELVVDNPEKVNQDRDETISPPFIRLDQMLDNAKEEFIAVTPYFVPREEGVQWFDGLIKRGLDVKVITNSLAATDAVAVHTGYRRYRADLIRSGVELYELKPIGGRRPQQRLIGSSAPAHASLHAKVYVTDRKDVMIGSFNFDPRSLEINTEIAMVVHSPEIAKQVIAMFEEVSSPENSYRMIIDDDNRLTWLTEENGVEKRYHHEPKAGFFRNIQVNAFSLLPIEDQL